MDEEYKWKIIFQRLHIIVLRCSSRRNELSRKEWQAVKVHSERICSTPPEMRKRIGPGVCSLLTVNGGEKCNTTGENVPVTSFRGRNLLRTTEKTGQ
ncbi:UNVERIFIED_CONTAM: hypothetical protein PYX00_000243 [Menopon gallinae]|uniref:Ribosomal protein S14 n=1 Tax=Menopon gallinae TaxID=328185 RepID=A0AAW2I8G4_9NEOP